MGNKQERGADHEDTLDAQGDLGFHIAQYGSMEEAAAMLGAVVSSPGFQGHFNEEVHRVNFIGALLKLDRHEEAAEQARLLESVEEYKDYAGTNEIAQNNLD